MEHTLTIQPLVSVIIPAHNGDRFIVQAIDSVLQQTYRQIEIIVVDDGSTDNTATVLQPYLDRIRYIRQTNYGVAVARNRGLEIAQGELIAFLDQDDLFVPDKLAMQVAGIAADPSLGIVHSGWQITTDQGNAIASIQPWQGLPTLDLCAWVQWKPVFLGAMVFQRQWLERSGGFNPNYQQTNDVELLLRLAAMGCPATWVKQTTVLYRQHAHNASRQVLEQSRELEAVLDIFFGRSDLPDFVKQLEPESRHQSLVWSAWRLYHNGYVDESVAYLEKSLLYTKRPQTETILHWIEQFKQYESEYGKAFTIHSLNQVKAWHDLTQKMLINQ